VAALVFGPVLLHLHSIPAWHSSCSVCGLVVWSDPDLFDSRGPSISPLFSIAAYPHLTSPIPHARNRARAPTRA